MSGIKCRLCQCLVDKQTGFSCSLNDDGFRSMIKTVFPFPISPVHKVASKTYEMPVLVCFQCSTAIRNFYNFSKQVEVTQNKLKTECMRKDDSLSVDELLVYIKAEPELQANETTENTTDSLMMSADVDDSECASQFILNHTSSIDDNKIDLLDPTDESIEQELEVFLPTENPISCVDKSEVITSIANMEKRITSVTEKLDLALRNMQKPDANQQTSSMYDTFDFVLISSKEECARFNNELAEKEYMEKILQWLNGSISTPDSKKRIVKAIDLMFSRQFLAVCTWTGERSLDRNVAFRRYKNIMTLLKYAGTTHMSRLDDRMVVDFLKKRLKHAKHRVGVRVPFRANQFQTGS
uniref:ZAD domain-containing protein n=1 Tax=Anopheles atroparvus TaxID=41427 RepID=A0AAG5DES8_ANOAO